MNRILIVEDEPEMGDLLSQSLTDSGYFCVVARDGLIGLAQSPNADLILVDVMLPAINGFELVKKLRAQGYRTPIIFLTARDATKDLVLGLELGGDDYLIKPFKLEELLARVKALLRRSRESSPVVVWHEFKIDCSKRIAFRGSQEIFFSPTEFSLFEFLMRHAETVMSKTTILEELWADEGYRRENIVETYINYVRGKTEANGASRVIHTIHRRGYVLAKAHLEP